MSVQTTHEKSVKKYVMAITMFVIVVSLCLAIFFVSLFDYVRRAVESEIWETMTRQSNHIDISFSIRFEQLEAAADFLGKQEDIHGEVAMQCIQSLGMSRAMRHVAIYDTDGNAVLDNGETFETTDLTHIQRALEGKRGVSNPTQSRVDNVMRFYLSVPILNGDEIIGVLSGSFDTDQIGSLIFEDSYEGQSVLFVTDLNGRVAYSNEPPGTLGVRLSQDFYDQLRQAEFLDGGNAEELIVRLERQERGLSLYRQKSGSTVFLLYTPIHNSSLLLMHAIPREAAYGEFKFIEISVIVVGAVLLVCVILLVVFMFLNSTNSQRDLVHIAQTDLLTGLLNKQFTREAVDQWLKSDACTGIQALMFLDIDYFKQINDQYGHSVGDDALRFVGQAMRQEFRSSDIIGRIGGDEFLVFMRNVPVKQVVRSHTESLCARLKNADIPGLDKGMLHCSIGIAYAPEHGVTYQALTNCADKALYQTKERGRDGFTEYVESVSQKKV